MRTTTARTFGIAVLLVLGLVASGCGGDDASDSSPSPSACTDVMALQASLTALTQVDPVNDGVDALKSAAAEVKTDLEAALSAVSSELKPAVDEVKTAFDGLEIGAQGSVVGGRARGGRDRDRHRDDARSGARRRTCRRRWARSASCAVRAVARRSVVGEQDMLIGLVVSCERERGRR